jgi:PAS domain S-box-containing protein
MPLFPYLTSGNIRRLFSRQRLRLLPEKAGAAVGEIDVRTVVNAGDFDVFAPAAFLPKALDVAAAFVMDPAGEIVWESSERPLSLKSVRDDVLLHLKESKNNTPAVIRRDTDSAQLKPVSLDGQVRYVVVVPLRTRQNRLMGALAVADDRRHPLSPEDNKALQALGAQISRSLELRREIEEVQEARKGVETIKQAIPPAVSEESIVTFLHRLAETAGVEAVLVTGPIENGTTTVNVRHFSFQGGALKPFDYALPGSVLQEFGGGESFCCDTGAQAKFSQDARLKGWKIEGAAGRVVRGTSGQVTGALVVLGRSPLLHPHKTAQILESAAGWLGAALEAEDLRRARAQTETQNRDLQDKAARLAKEEEEKKHWQARWEASWKMPEKASALTDADGRILEVNPSLEQMLGVSAKDCIGKTLADWETAETAILPGHLALALSGARVSRVETIFRNSDGNERRVRLTLNAVAGAPDQTRLCLVTLQDVQEDADRLAKLAQLEKEHSESLARELSLWEQEGAAVAAIGANGHVLRASPAFVEMTGYTRDELLHKTLGELLAEENQAQESESRAECFSGTRTRYAGDRILVRKHEPNAQVRWTGTAIRQDGKCREILVSISDLKPLWEAQERVRTLEQRWNSAFIKSAPPMALLTDNGHIIEANRALAEWSGMKAVDMRHAAIADWLEAEEAEEFRETLKQCESAARVSIQFDRKFTLASGRENWARLTVTKAEFPAETEIAWVAHWEDTGERHRLEQEAQEHGADWKTLLARSPLGMFTAAADGSILEMNSTLAGWLGLTPAETEGQDWRHYLPEETLAEAETHAEEVLQGNRDSFQVEGALPAQGSRVPWTRWTLFPVTDETGATGKWMGLVQDLTERRQAERALAVQEAPLHAALETTGCPVFQADREGRLTRVNAPLAKLLGHPSTKLIGKSFEEFLQPADAGVAADLVNRVLAGEKEASGEARVRSGQHQDLWIRLHVGAAAAESGAPEYLLGWVEEISWKKRIQTALDDLGAKWSQIFVQSDIPLLWLSPGGDIQEANAAFQNLTGYDPEQLLAQSFTDLVSPDNRKMAEDFRKESLQGEDSRLGIELDLTGHDDRFTPVRLDLTRVIRADGKTGGWLGHVTDLTPVKNLQKALQTSVSRAQALLDGFALGAALVDGQNRIVRANSVLAHFAGRTAEELTGTSPASLVADEDRAGEAEMRQEIWSQKRDRFTRELRLQGKNQPPRWVELTGVGMTDEQEGTRSLLWMAQDITARKQLEQMLREREASLDAKSKEATILSGELDQTRQSLEAKELELSTSVRETGRKIAGLEADLEQYKDRLERKEMEWEQARLRFEDRWKALFDLTGVGVAELDAQGHILAASPDLLSLLDTDIADLRGQTWSAAAHEEDSQTDEKLWTACLQGEANAYTCEKWFNRKDGTPVCTSLAVVVWRNPEGKVAGALSLLIDTTPLHTAQTDVRMSETQFRALGEAARFGLVLADDQDRILYANPLMETLTGKTTDELNGTKFWEAVTVDGDVPEESHADLDAGPAHREITLKNPEGPDRKSRITRAAIRDPQNAVVGLLRIIEDKTALEQAAEEKRRLNEELETNRKAADALRSEKEALLSEKEKLQNEKMALQTEKDSLKTEINSVQGVKDSLQNEKSSLRTENDSLLSEKKSLQTEKDSLEAQIIQLRQDLEEAVKKSQEIEELREQLFFKEKDLAEAREKAEETAKKVSETPPTEPPPAAADPGETDALRRKLKNLEENLQGLETRFQALVEYLPAGVALAGVNGLIVQSNPALGALLGFETAELIGKPVKELMESDDQVRYGEWILDCLQGKTPSAMMEACYLRKDETRLNLRTTAVTVKGKEDKIAWLFYFFEKVS